MVRTRFAPSPTGFLHIGGARTALYCWLYAKKTKGTFILRIEDTDLERSTPESVDAILDGMVWLNLQADEGPFYQTQRFDRYKTVIAEMLAAGTAYRCYCSKERLETLRTTQMENKEKPRYDGHCLNASLKDEPFVVRFKNPKDGVVQWDDLVRGNVSFENTELDDLIIARTDGTPTYNFTVVIDDMDMKITHVIRGDDHVNNTPRQINIFKALKAPLPLYAHVPMILGSDGKRLSKRHGAQGVMEYRDMGILPHALLNYLARLGWSHGDQEIFSIDELIQYFEMTDINRAPAAYNLDKLLWLNQHYMKNDDPEEIAAELAWHFGQLGVDVARGPLLTEVVKAQVERVKTLREMAERSRYFYEPVVIDAAHQAHLSPELMPALTAVRNAFETVDWTKEAIHGVLTAVAESLGLKMGKVAQPIRVVMTGGTASPSIDLTILLIGRDESIKRLNNAISLLTNEG